MNARLIVVVLSSACTLGLAQGLYAPARQPEEGPAPPLALKAVSSLYVAPPEPRAFAKHDLITIIIDESSSATAEQTLDTKKEYDTSAKIGTVIDPWELLELRLREGGSSDVTLIDATADRQFKGDGEYERTDRFSARITATVLDVKPNGTIVLEATKRIEKDTEIQTLVLAGTCREDDITAQNTVLSSQIAGLTISLQNEGEVKDTAKKGLLSRVLDTIFAF